MVRHKIQDETIRGLREFLAPLHARRSYKVPVYNVIAHPIVQAHIVLL
jgi:hypothetical protein